MNLPPDVVDAVEDRLETRIRGHRPVGGGCIAHACQIETERGPYFLKWSRDEAARTFAAEAEGLRALRRAEGDLVVPEPLVAREAEGRRAGLLLLEWIEQGARDEAFWERFGRGLATLHRTTEERYGFSRDNFIGRLPQRNTWETSWPAFFRAHRLEPQVAAARAEGRWRAGWDDAFERLVDRLDALLPERPEASLLHGDLWGGNFMVDARARPVLVDPAAYYGHRETDLAMSELFGGFDGRFYAAYREAWPLEPGYEERRSVYNLYHLINHLNHFGGGYAGSVDAELRRLL